MDNVTLSTFITRSHPMPFGTNILPDGSIRFRLWAPSAKQVELVLHGHETPVPLTQTKDGFYECLTTLAHPGTLYQYRIDGDLCVPDPASRYQPQDVHGPSCVMDPAAFQWQDSRWSGRPWEETVLYELHVGTFTPEGTFRGVQTKLDYLVDLGVTAIELMPLSDFPGKHNWGYDGVLPFAPDSRYGTPDDLKALVQVAHAKGLMVFVDVVYNHFGPEGNYLHAYAQPFFTRRYKTPWGDAIDFEGSDSNMVRAFFIHNALYWLEEFHVDGLRLDAVHAIEDASTPHILEELAQAVRQGPGRHRHIHLVLENDDNQATLLMPGDKNSSDMRYTAQWNDDIHHALHVLTTRETEGYYLDYADHPSAHLARCLSAGFAYQGQHSPYRDNHPRGEPSTHLPPTRFVAFLQNHDQVGNRAFGERITAIADPQKVHVAAAVYLLSPQIPLIFMGEEWAASEPFLFFCDFGTDLAQAVTDGRRREFSRFPEFSNPQQQARIPDPSAETTFYQSQLNWEYQSNSIHQEWLSRYKHLISLRHQEIIPILSANPHPISTTTHCFNDEALMVSWTWPQEKRLVLYANFGGQAVSCNPQSGRIVYETAPGQAGHIAQGMLPALSAVWMEPTL